MIDRPHSLRFVNGRIDPSDRVPAGALVTQDGVIRGVGAERDTPSAEATTDLGGALMMPGSTDAHLHLLGPATERLPLALDPKSVRPLSGLLDRVSSAARRVPTDTGFAALDLTGTVFPNCDIPLVKSLPRQRPTTRFSSESFAVILRC
jgi:predicted amidohydrolase YtcJ